MPERTWSHCPVCEGWYPTEEMVPVKKGFVWRGYRSFYMCRPCAKRVVEQRKKKKGAV